MPVPAVGLNALATFTVISVERKGDRASIAGDLIRPEQLKRRGVVSIWIDLDRAATAKIVALDRPNRRALLDVAATDLHASFIPAARFAVFDSYWLGAVRLVLDQRRSWKQIDFRPRDAFEQPNPGGGRMWRIATDADRHRTDGRIVPGGWDHEHCDICWAKVSESNQRGAYVDDRDHWLCEMCHSMYVQRGDVGFVVHGAYDPQSPRTADDDAFDRLSTMVLNRDLAALDRYAAGGGNVDVRNRYGWTPLMIAAGDDEIESLALLAKLGADIDAVSRHGYTPLANAAQNGAERAVDLLLQLGATPQVPDELCGGSLLTYVKTGHGRENPRISQMLRDAGAR